MDNKKLWVSPEISELPVANTEFDPAGGTIPDVTVTNTQTGQVIQQYYTYSGAQNNGPRNPYNP